MTGRPAATLQARYVEQAAADLADNRRRQQELAEQIAVLKQEEALLADILQLAERYDGFPDASRLPEQPGEEPPAAPARRPARSRSAAAAAAKGTSTGTGTGSSKAGAPQSGVSKAGASTSGTAKAGTSKAGATGASHRPLLGDLLAELLGGHDEPRLAQELRDELMTRYPDRAPTPQVVRNTLESLVAKGRVQRHKQQRSVMYTVVAPGGDAADPA